MDWIGGWCWLDRYELEDLASEVLTFRSPTVCWTLRRRGHRDSSATRTSLMPHRDSLRCRGGCCACSRPVRPGPESAPDRCCGGGHGDHGEPSTSPGRRHHASRRSSCKPRIYAAELLLRGKTRRSGKDQIVEFASPSPSLYRSAESTSAER